MRSPRARAALLAAALAAPAALAGAEAPILGGDVALVFPQSDLNGGHWLHGNTGAGCGVHLLCPLDGGHALRLRGDAAWLPRGPVDLRDAAAVDQESAKVCLFTAGVDYNYFPAIHPEGPYLIVGLGYAWIRAYGVTSAAAGPWPSRQDGSAPTYALGLGSRFSPHLGGELRFTGATFKDLGSAGSRVQAPAFSAALTLDF